MTAKLMPSTTDELAVLNDMVPLQAQQIAELGCGAAALARSLLKRYPACRVSGVEIDQIQHAKNLAAPQDGLTFILAGAQDVPLPDASTDLVMMLKSLHHVPLPLMSAALAEVARLLRVGGYFYFSEPVYGGPFNELVRIYNDEGKVRAAAQGAVDLAWCSSGCWEQVDERRFSMPIRFRDFAEYEAKHMHPSFADHKLDDAKIAAVRTAFEPHMTSDGATFQRLMHVRLLRRLPTH